MRNRAKAGDTFSWQIYDPPNLGLIQVMTGPQAAVMMLSVATRVAAAYKAAAPKRTGALGASARASIQKSKLGKYRGDRWVGVVTVTAPYAVWNLTGAGPGKHRRSTGKRPRFGPFEGHYTFDKIIKEGNRVGNPK